VLNGAQEEQRLLEALYPAEKPERQRAARAEQPQSCASKHAHKAVPSAVPAAAHSGGADDVSMQLPFRASSDDWCSGDEGVVVTDLQCSFFRSTGTEATGAGLATLFLHPHIAAPSMECKSAAMGPSNHII